jgi:DNA-binding CsgD family transcriptional regulator
MLNEYDETKSTNDSGWLSWLVKHRLGDWQRSQSKARRSRIRHGKDPYIYVSYDEDIHAVPAIEYGYWFVDEINSRKPAPIKSEKRFRTMNLTKREKQILTYLANGYSLTETGNLAGVSLETIKSHRKNIIKKLEAAGTTNAVAIALRQGEIQ